MRLATLFSKIRLALQTPLCRVCGCHLPVSEAFCKRCRQSLGFRPAQPLARTPRGVSYAATTLTPALKKRLYGYKFYNRRDELPVLSDLLIDYWAALPEGENSACSSALPAPEQVLVIPVPPHPGKKSRVAPLAVRFADHFGYDYRLNALFWMRQVTPQHDIPAKSERLQNTQGALAADGDCLAGYHRLIVVDDLTTTGATLREAVRALRYAKDAPDPFPSIATLALSAVMLGRQGAFHADVRA